MGNEEIAIKTEGLRKVFGRFRKRIVAVKELNMEIERSTIHGFIGPNGAGKTTTIKMLVGAIRPTKGKAFIFDEPVGSVKAKRYIGYSPEHPNFYPMSAIDFLIYMGRISGMKREEARKRAKELMEWIGLEGFENKNAQRFSAGMKQKLSIVQALIHDPDILILDEPTANLDPIGRFEVIGKIGELARKERKTVFISSHILYELEKIVDHVTIIKRGNVLLQSSIASLRKRFSENHFIIDTSSNKQFIKRLEGIGNVKKVWINHEGKIEVNVSNGERFKKELIDLVKNSNIIMNEFSPYKMSLENIFIKLVESE
ncbi:MAG TPA: ABC transporter ATP-binding protein [Candidatus Aenigmarchaeota archaeon]|nr:MAG: ABC transporter ATP-binding protein [Candidatus Aenigmarchaeota archaeon]HDD46087.1 ABC transporter ATP-binding protein [Candidatus Aenigmarchaeota archaeon]